MRTVIIAAASVMALTACSGGTPNARDIEQASRHSDVQDVRCTKGGAPNSARCL